MANIIADRVLETSTTTGTGAYTLNGAVTGFRTFASTMVAGDTADIYVEDVDANGIPTGSWEVGTYTFSAGTLLRTAVTSSSNANAAVNWAAGTRRLGITVIAATATSGSATLRNIATRPSICNSLNTTNKQTMSRSRHVARSTVRSLKLLYGNWWGDLQNSESGSGASTTYRAAIEYPEGTITQVKFSGSADGVVVDLGEIISDETFVNIPVNAQFWIRTWTSNTIGILYIAKPASPAHGEAFEFGATTTDKTMSGTLVNSTSGLVTPYAILGMSSAPSSFLFGDSRVFGQNDSYTNSASNDQGILARAVGATSAYINCGIPADRLEKVVLSDSRRVSLAKRFCTEAIVALGINDLNQYSRAASAVFPQLQTVWSHLAPMPVIACTLNPVSTSTNSFATTGDQTTASCQTQRVLFNNMIRETVSVSAVLDLADIVETYRDSGIWKSPGYTQDGLHETQKACAIIANSRTGLSAPTPEILYSALTRPVKPLTALNMDCATGDFFTKTISANSTLTFSNIPASGTAYSCTVELTITAGTLTHPTGTIWPGAVTPTLAVGKTHLLYYLTRDGGTTWRASALAGYSS